MKLLIFHMHESGRLNVLFGQTCEVNTQPKGQKMPINSFYFHLVCEHVIKFQVTIRKPYAA